MSGKIIDPRTGLQGQHQPVVIQIDKIKLPLPTDDAKAIADAAAGANNGQLPVTPGTIVLWIETARALERLSKRIDALEAAGVEGTDDTRAALRAMMGDKPSA